MDVSLDLQVLRNSLGSKRVVFTHGAFDVLHFGHLNFLESSRECGDVLVVGVHTDSDVRKAKGQSRPVFPLEARLRMLAALRCVDYVVPCNRPDAADVIRELRPDVYVKDSACDPESSVEARTVASYGGKLVVMPYTVGISTSIILSAEAPA